MSMIRMTELTKHYGAGPNVVRALDGVSVSIAAGEFVSIVGRSGSGKTTMLDLIGLLMRPTSGQLVIDEVDTTSLGETQLADLRSRRIGFIFQEYNLLPALNVLDNVLLPVRYSGSSDKNARPRALELLERVGLAERANHRPRELSGGQQQRVAIARSLMNRPALILGDEPTGAVDTSTATELIEMLAEMNRTEGVTLVIVTHDMDIAARTSRIIRLRDGRIAADENTGARPFTPALTSA
jgi:putative ABC transport system ATP-binding protein